MSYKLSLLIIFFLGVKSFASTKENWIDNKHRILSKRITTFSESVDLWLGNIDKKNRKIEENKSFLRIGFETLFRESGGPVVTPELDYRLVLPNTERKLQLIVSRENDDDETDRAQSQTDAKNNVAEETSAALGYIFDTAGIETSVTTGVILGIPTKLFSSLKLERDVALANKWVLVMKEEVKWVNTDGFYSDTDIDFERPLGKKLRFKFINNMFWDDTDYMLTFKNGPSLYQAIDDRKSLSYHAHVISKSQPNWYVTNYILQINYRQLVYKNWIHLGITPFVNFPIESNFHRSPGIIFNLDFTFGYLK